MKKVSMSEIAKELGISKVSVSKALGDKDGVSEELREKIKHTAQNMGYRINNSARSLKTDRQYNIGILIGEKFVMDNEAYYFSVCGEITKKLDAYGTSGIMEIISFENEKDKILPRVYNEKKVDGIIVLGQLSNEYLTVLEQMTIPMIYFDFYRQASKIDSIVADNFCLGYQLTDLLIERGHKEIAYVGSINATSSIQDRYLGYYKALIENNLKLNFDYIIDDRDECGKLLEELELPKNMPTAFVCNCDRVAFTLITKLKSLGIKIPEDVSVVGFDNSLFSTIADPKITTVDNNIEKMVSTAVKVISKKINNPQKTYDRILVPGTIIERDSVKSLN
ncbi:MAG: LacI family DNA-binding transcriptional regulator [Candidatus Izemoplasmatales bacterium]|nr:LacI family DNA-binding transcriptional regulator [Candidatus Izemoplasmatales bacterium]